ncbi:MAG: hypothetical protein HFF02_06705 [Erysipelotrichaceae bacterium]|nr:hypothetical protein [Erysipelotrichaceae bacterium]
MTYEETRSILTVLKINYPQSFKGWTAEQGEAFLNLWSEAFKDDPVQMVVMAVKAIICSDTREFAPNIGQVKDRMVKLSNSMTLDADQAWAMVYKALSNSIYNSEKEFDKLPSEVRAGIGSASQLREWAQMDTATLESVIASNFKKGYRNRVQERVEFEKLPNQVKTMIQGLTDSMRIGSGER